MKKLFFISLILVSGFTVSANAAAKKRSAPVVAANVAAGQAGFNRWGAACHSAGPLHPGTTALQAKYNGALPAELERRTDFEPETIHYFLRNGISIMPPFRKTEVTDKEEQDLIAYLRRNNARNPR